MLKIPVLSDREMISLLEKNGFVFYVNFIDVSNLLH